MFNLSSFKTEFKEVLIAYTFLVVVFLPVRLFFVSFISDNWLGSLGLIALMGFLIVFLSKKGKLGRLGNILIKQMFKAHRGKRKYFVYAKVGIATLYLGTVVVAIGIGHTDFQDQVDEVLILLPDEYQEQLDQGSVDSQKKSLEKAYDQIEDMRPEQIIGGSLALLLMPVTDFEMYAILNATIDELSNGWYNHFYQVFFIEMLEVVGILIYTRLTIKQKDLKSTF